MAAKKQIKLKNGDMTMLVYEKSLGLMPHLLYVKTEIDQNMIDEMRTQLIRAYELGYEARSREVSAALTDMFKTKI